MLSTRFRIFALLAAAITLSAAGAQSEPTPGKGKVRQGVGAKQAKRQKGMQAAQAKAGAKPKAGANPKAAAKKDAKPQTEPAVIDERAEGVLREWAEKLAARKDYQVHINSEFTMAIGGIRRNQPREFDITVLRPSHLRIHWAEQGVENEWIRRDTELLNYRGAIHKYKVEEIDSAKDSMQKALSQVFGNLKADRFMTALLADDPMQITRWTATKIDYIGKEDIDGKPAHHLNFISDEVDWAVWFSADEGALPIRLVPDASKELKAQGLAGVSYEVKLDFVDWKLDKGVEASAFDFTPPDGVEKVDTFNPHAKGGPKPTPAAGAEGLVGKPAPGFSLDVLGGGKADLAAHKGKDIVVLDFWATWCGPCRRALPVIASACGKFENVKMYAVNLREDVERISKFLETQDLKVTVALDKGETGQAYGANRIPLSIVIDKDGVVQAIHRGFSDDLGSQLEGELKQLLEGKKLAPPQ